MSNWIKNIRKVEPYVPGEQPKETNIIKLNTNENPYPPSPLVTEAMSSLTPDSLRRYPDAKVEKLVKKLAAYHNVNDDMVFVGVGSDDVLGMSFMTFFNSEKEILFADVTYSFYPVWAEMLDIKYRTIPLNEKFEINKNDYMRPNGGIVIANPNAPTGIIMDKQDIHEIIENNPDSIIIIDEAYIDFADEGLSCLDMINEFDNLIVVRTFSKSRNLAGLRVGYAVSNPVLIKYLNDVKYSYNSYTMNPFQIECGSASVDDDFYFRDSIAKVKKTREYTLSKLKELGFDVLPSSTNFVFASHKSVNAVDIFNYLREKEIYVRHFSQDRIDNYLRITIGTDEEMNSLFEALDTFLSDRNEL